MPVEMCSLDTYQYFEVSVCPKPNWRYTVDVQISYQVPTGDNGTIVQETQILLKTCILHFEQ